MKKTILFLSALLVIPGILQAQSDLQTMMERADSLYHNFNERPALDIYRKVLAKDPDNYEALWKTSFLYSRIGNRLESKEEQKEYFNKAISLAQRALDVDSTDTQSNFVMSVAMGRKAIISGARDRVAASRDIKKYAERAIRYDSTNAGAWHVLGRWNLKVANLNFFERLAANALFGGIPGHATNEKALKDIQKAIELNPRYILYYHDLASVYDEMGQKDQAVEACREAIDHPLITPDDKRLKDECRHWIEDWQ